MQLPKLLPEIWTPYTNRGGRCPPGPHLLRLWLKENRFKEFARDINTKESLNSEGVEPYPRKEWLRYENCHVFFHVFNK